MYKKLLASISILSILSALIAFPVAAAYNYSGKYFGMLVQNPIDLDGDGTFALSGVLRGSSGMFSYIEVNIDNAVEDPLDPQGVCDPGETETVPAGQITFSNSQGTNSVLAVIDSTAHVCTGLVPRDVQLTIVGGRGLYANATGTGTFTLVDTTPLSTDPITGAPRVMYVHNSQYTIHIN